METLGDLPPDQARLWMHRVAGWVADYRDTLEQRRVAPDVTPGAVARVLGAAPPEHGEPLGQILEDVERLLMPGMVHAGHPRYLGHFGSTTTAPGILGEWLTAALNVSVSTWRTAPAATELEATVLAWIRDLLGLPAGFDGVVHDSTGVATLHALAAAREAAGLDVRRRGLAGAPKLTVYATDHVHGAVRKAAALLGLGEDSLRRVESDAEHRMRPAALRALVARDVYARLRPLAVVATVGTTATGAVDPVPSVADVCREHGLWLHVDASYGGAMALLPDGRWVLDGVGRADSVVITPHTWLFVPLDFSALYVRRLDALRAVFAAPPPATEDVDPAARDYADYTLARGRRFRALKAWVVLRAFGRAGLAARLGEQVRLARRFADWVDADPDFELAAPPGMAIVCFRANPPGLADDEVDALNRRLVAQLASTGRVYLTLVELGRRPVLRVAVGNVLTTESHLAEAWTLVHDALDRELIG
jgi:aromatic-L-amino-acid decarboxylase